MLNINLHINSVWRAYTHGCGSSSKSSLDYNII